VLLVRLSQVTDWEEGGRTSSRAAARIFSKEVAEGPRQVLVARREVRWYLLAVIKGVCPA
jgi:hypothetical protein